MYTYTQDRGISDGVTMIEEQLKPGSDTALFLEARNQLVPWLIKFIKALDEIGFCVLDIKPDNLVYCNGTWKFVDIASLIRKDELCTTKYSPCTAMYLPPWRNDVYLCPRVAQFTREISTEWAAMATASAFFFGAIVPYLRIYDCGHGHACEHLLPGKPLLVINNRAYYACDAEDQDFTQCPFSQCKELCDKMQQAQLLHGFALLASKTQDCLNAYRDRKLVRHGDDFGNGTNNAKRLCVRLA